MELAKASIDLFENPICSICIGNYNGMGSGFLKSVDFIRAFYLADTEIFIVFHVEPHPKEECLKAADQ